MSEKKFKRQNSQEKKLKDSWRRPKGRHSSLRKGKGGKGKKPSPGYGSQRRGVHPSGLFEVLVRNPKDLEKIDPETQAARISSTIGKRKEEEIRKRAEKMNIKILN